MLGVTSGQALPGYSAAAFCKSPVKSVDLGVLPRDSYGLRSQARFGVTTPNQAFSATPELTAYRQAVGFILKEAPTGYPLALWRMTQIEAQEAAHGGASTSMPWDLDDVLRPLPTALGAQATGKAREEALKGLIPQQITQPWQAYLTAHVVALESLVARRSLSAEQLGTTALPLIRRALEDAYWIAGHRSPNLYGKKARLMEDDQYQLMYRLPKVALHEHQRGAAPLSMVRAMFLQQGDAQGLLVPSQLEERCRVERLYTPAGEGPLYTPGLPKFLEKYNQVAKNAIRSSAHAYLAAYLYTLTVALENVRYFEYRFNPMTGGDPVRYARLVQLGIDDAKAFLWQARRKKIDANLLFTAYRMNLNYNAVKQNPDQARRDRVADAMQVLEAAIAARKAGLRVTGFDIAGDEENFAIVDFAPVAERLKAYNRRVPKSARIGATIHAGETPVSGRMSHPDAVLSGAESINQAINLFWDSKTPMRIGHGVRVVDDPSLLKRCVRLGIGFEQCPKSNVQTGAIPYYTQMPTLALLRQGAAVSLSTDNRTLSKTTNTNELVKLTKHLGATHEARKALQLNGIHTAFTTSGMQRLRLLRDINQQIRRLEASPGFQRAIASEKAAAALPDASAPPAC